MLREEGFYADLSKGALGAIIQNASLSLCIFQVWEIQNYHVLRWLEISVLLSFRLDSGGRPRSPFLEAPTFLISFRRHRKCLATLLLVQLSRPFCNFFAESRQTSQNSANPVSRVSGFLFFFFFFFSEPLLTFLLGFLCVYVHVRSLLHTLSSISISFPSS